jgi:membrane protein DedA with SNARE-associated domain
MNATIPPKASGLRWIWKTIFGFDDDKQGRPSKYWHYLFVTSIFIITVCVLALLNVYFSFINISSYNINQQGASSPFLLAGYFGMFDSIVFLVPDYILVPVCGYLSLIGLFNPYYTFLVCLASAVLPIEYFCGRLAARPFC